MGSRSHAASDIETWEAVGIEFHTVIALSNHGQLQYDAREPRMGTALLMGTRIQFRRVIRS